MMPPTPAETIFHRGIGHHFDPVGRHGLQTFATVAPYTVEEAYEVADAIELRQPHRPEERNWATCCCRWCSTRGWLRTKARSTSTAVGRSHQRQDDPPPSARVRRCASTARQAEQTEAWEAIDPWGAAPPRPAPSSTAASLLDDVPVGLPALTRAVKLSQACGPCGVRLALRRPEVIAKLHEEVADLEAEVAAGDVDKARDELGDVLFVCANLARELGVDPEAALRKHRMPSSYAVSIS